METRYIEKKSKYNELKKNYNECVEKIDDLVEEFRQLKKEKNEYSNIINPKKILVKSTLVYSSKFDKKDALYFSQIKNPPSVIEDMGNIILNILQISNYCHEDFRLQPR
jgi:predicted nuclease with TOPRIM domain